MNEHIRRQRAQALVVALVGADNAPLWWSSANLAFEGRTPTEQWVKDHILVYDYLMGHAEGKW